MSSIYETIETEIKALLDGKAWDNCEIKTAIERSKDYEPPVTKILLVIQYAGSKFGASRTTNPIAQDETGSFNILLHSKKLRGAIGIYDFLSKVRQTLQGFQPTVSSRMELAPDKGVEFVEFNADLWQFAITFNTTWVAVQELDDSDDPTITELNLIDV